MSETIKKVSDGIHSLELWHDDWCESPRKWDNIGTPVCFHKRYSFGDKYPEESPNEWLASLTDYHFSWMRWEAKFTLTEDEEEKEVFGLDDVIDYLEKDYIILPVYMYEHSGVALSTSDFGDRWDSGQIGWIYCSIDKAQKEFGNTEDLKSRTERAMRDEIEILSHYVNGECYGFSIVEDETDEVIDSCGGFIGSMKEVLTDMASQADYDYQGLFQLMKEAL